MKKKYFIILLVFCLGISMFVGSVKAAESEVSHREIAIAAALCWVPPEEGNTLSQFWNFDVTHKIGEIVNNVNEKFNLNGYGDIEELDDWIVDSVLGGKTAGVIDKKGTSGYTLKRGNDLIVIFASTNGPQDVLDDIVGYGLKNESAQEPYADEYLTQVLDKYAKENGEYNIYVAGHSLGGYLAQTAGARAEKLITDNKSKYENLQIKQIVSFNGIGINFFTKKGDLENYGNKKEVITTLKQMGSEGRLISYFTYGDFVSALGVHYGEMRMLYPSIDSISSQRELYSLGKAKGNSTLINTLAKLDNGWLIFEENTFKTEVDKGQKFYQVGNFISYFCLTHVADTFATIDLAEAKKRSEPVLTVAEKSLLPITISSKGISSIETVKDITLKATTSYAGTRKYEWYSSDDGTNWTLLKTVDLYNLNGVVPENIMTIDVDAITVGTTKKYKVIAYYDDNYVSQSVQYNEQTGEYKYVVNEEKSRQEKPKTIESIVEVKHKGSIVSNSKGSNQITDILKKISTIRAKNTLSINLKDTTTNIKNAITSITSKLFRK